MSGRLTHHTQHPNHMTTETHEKHRLIPRLGLFTTTMIVVGAVIGSGIFRTPGGMAESLIATGSGTPFRLLGIWLLAGMITLLGALSNAEVASMIPETGGQYVYFEKMYGPFPAYLYGWSVFGVIQTGSIAAIAYVFAEYTIRFFGLGEMGVDPNAFSFHLPFIGDIRPAFELNAKMIASGVILLLTIINYFGVRFGGAVQNFFTVSKVLAMLILIGVAFLVPGEGAVANLTTPSSVGGGETLLIFGIAAALQGAFWTYDGWNNVTYIAGEVHTPQSSIPRALIYGLGTIITVYILINLAYAYILPIDQMATSKLVASDVADRLFTDGGTWIALLVMVSTFGTTNGTILASARVYFSMARRNVFPRFLGSVHERYRTPAASLFTQCAWSIMLVFTGTFNTLIDMLLFVSWVFYAAGAWGLFILRRKYPTATRPYRVPLYPFVPALFILFALAYLVLTVYNDIDNYIRATEAGEPALINSAMGLVLVLIGAPIYFYYRRKHAKVNESD